jgi:maleylpyruvate isomerase
MPVDLDANPAHAIGLCQAAHTRLLTTARQVTDEQVRSPSLLPGWTIGHVFTHLARNADGHTRRLEGALRGEDVPRYPGGTLQRDREIGEGAPRPAAGISADLESAQRALELAWERSAAAGWPNPGLRRPTTSSPASRLEEVEMHHVDLGLGYQPADWPDDYVAWALPRLLATVPSRLRRGADACAFVAWLSGRKPMPATIQLEPW